MESKIDVQSLVMNVLERFFWPFGVDPWLPWWVWIGVPFDGSRFRYMATFEPDDLDLGRFLDSSLPEDVVLLNSIGVEV